MKTFEQWLAVLDVALICKCSLSHMDLPDCPYRDWYDDGVNPRLAALRAIRNAKEY